MNQPKKVAIYARVSTQDQSYDMQLRDLEHYSKSRGWTIVKQFVEKQSGSDSNREQYQALIDFAKKRKCDIVLVWKFDRFSRSVVELVNNMHLFKEIGVEFCSFKENVDTTTSTGKMVFTIFAALAEMERENISQRVRSGIEHAKKHGTKTGNKHGRPVTSLAELRVAIPMMWSRLKDEKTAFTPKQIQRRSGISKSVYYKIFNTLQAMDKGEINYGSLLESHAMNGSLLDNILTQCRLLKLPFDVKR